MKSSLLSRTFQILELVGHSAGPVTLKELCSALALPPSTVSRIAADLVSGGYLEKSGYRAFIPSVGLVHLGMSAQRQYRFSRLAEPLIREKTAAFGTGGAFAAIHGGRTVYLFRCAPPGRVLPEPLADSEPLGESFAGQMILALTEGADPALRHLQNAFAEEHPDLVLSQTEYSRWHRVLTETRANGYLFTRLERGRWSICFPVETQERFFALEFFGDGPAEIPFDRLLFECSRLASRIRSICSE